ncbi:MAG TPA: hypothetical protein VGG75_21015 [Trebonia sp.]|jgi:hypothetical protein
MRDDPGTQIQGSLIHGSLMAETLGLAMARRAADILRRRQEAPDGAISSDDTRPPGNAVGEPGAGPGEEPARFAADDAVFSAVLDAANESLGRFDSRPSRDRWCDALMQIITLAESRPGG